MFGLKKLNLFRMSDETTAGDVIVEDAPVIEGPLPGEEIVVDQAMLDANPELAEAGVEVGTTGKVFETLEEAEASTSVPTGVSFVLKQDGDKFFWKRMQGSTFMYTSPMFDTEEEAEADMRQAESELI